jgi:hypothetical protein
MAAVDTIEVLDNLQFSHDNGDVIWAIDGEGSAFDVVKTYAIVVPSSVNAARVIFNNNYDTGAARVHVRVKATKLTGIGTLAKTENTQVLEWTAVAKQTFLDSGVIDLSAAYEATLHIDCAVTEAAIAHTGTEMIVQVRSEASTPAEWSTLTSFVGPTGTAFSIACLGNSTGGTKVVSATNPTAGNLNHIGKFLFLEDTGAIGQCEILFQTAFGADA